MNDFLTKDRIKGIFENLGIRKGSCICVQMDLSKFEHVVGNVPMIIETLKEIVGEDGCIFMPTFSFSCLDPACYGSENYNFCDWKLVRQSMFGYDGVNSDSEIYEEVSNLFLHSRGVIRSNHPVYSFGLWGNVGENGASQEINEPLSFQFPLNLMMQNNSYNVLIGVEPENALLLQAMGHRLQIGQTFVQRAFINAKKNQTKSFLVTKTNECLCKDLLDGCFMQQYDVGKNSIYALSLKNS